MSLGFQTEQRWDFLTIGGIKYDGVNAPNGITVVAGETIEWESDGSTTHQGFTICFDLTPAAPSAPPTNPPTYTGWDGASNSFIPIPPGSTDPSWAIL